MCTQREVELPPQPVCPPCGARPLLFHMQTEPVPLDDSRGGSALVTQIWCANPRCNVLLSLQVTGVMPAQATLESFVSESRS